MKRKTKRKLKNAFLKGFTGCMAVIWGLSILCADIAPLAVTLTALYGSTAWLVYFFWCNRWFGGATDDDI